MSALAVSGTDVYAVGQPVNAMSGAIWKNGARQDLSPDTASRASAVAVDGGDVYVAGWLLKTGTTSSGATLQTNVPTLWKNGEPTFLTDVDTPGGALAVAVAGGDVYVAGYVSPGATATCFVAMLWKNGVGQQLPDLAVATDLAVLEGDVYVGGGVCGAVDRAALWHGSATKPLTSGSYQAFVEAITVTSTGVRAVGYEGSDAVLWEDGVAKRLTVGFVQAIARDIVVVEH